MDLVSWTAIVTARQIAPSIMNYGWLVDNNIVGRDEFRQPSVFTDGFVQLQTSRYGLLATSEMLQFAPNPGIENEAALVAGTVGRIVAALPQSGYTAIGLNFIYHEIFEPQQIAGVTHQRFFVANIPLFREFDNPTSHFGAYLSGDWQALRIKLDIKPVVLRVHDQNQDRLQAMFNFHKDVDGAHAAQLQQITDVLALWDQAKDRSRQLSRIIRGDNP